MISGFTKFLGIDEIAGYVNILRVEKGVVKQCEKVLKQLIN